MTRKQKKVVIKTESVEAPTAKHSKSKAIKKTKIATQSTMSCTQGSQEVVPAENPVQITQPQPKLENIIPKYTSIARKLLKQNLSALINVLERHPAQFLLQGGLLEHPMQEMSLSDFSNALRKRSFIRRFCEFEHLAGHLITQADKSLRRIHVDSLGILEKYKQEFVLNQKQQLYMDLFNMDQAKVEQLSEALSDSKLCKTVGLRHKKIEFDIDQADEVLLLRKTVDELSN